MELRGEWWEVLVCWGRSLIFYQTTRAKENLECFKYCSETGWRELEAIAVSAHSPAWLWRSTRWSVNHLPASFTRGGILTRQTQGVSGLGAATAPDLSFTVLLFQRQLLREKEQGSRQKHCRVALAVAIRASKRLGSNNTTVRSSVWRVRPLQGSCRRKPLLIP